MPRAPFTAYVDESGDPGLANFDPDYPVFVLCVALYRTDDYLATEMPNLTRIKFQHWWHDAVIFHSHKIRNRLPPFQALKDPAKGGPFMASLAAFFAASPVTIIAAAIDKPRHMKQYVAPVHPYDLALQFCLERTYGHITKKLKPAEEVTFVFEKRGRTEDAILQKHFDRIIDKGNAWGKALPFRACFAGKAENILGLQVADLAAYPIARYVETKNDKRPDWTAVRPRIRTSAGGKMEGWGLKIFP